MKTLVSDRYICDIVTYGSVIIYPMPINTIVYIIIKWVGVLIESTFHFSINKS